MTVNKGIVLTDIVGKKIKFDILQTIIWQYCDIQVSYTSSLSHNKYLFNITRLHIKITTIKTFDY
jgi:hypothetical protein